MKAVMTEEFVQQYAQKQDMSVEFVKQHMMPTIENLVESQPSRRYTACHDQFERPDALPSSDGEVITWRGCTQGSNEHDIATAVARKRADGTWKLQNFEIQFCSIPEQECASKYGITGKQIEFHIRPEGAGGWRCREFNELLAPGHRSE